MENKILCTIGSNFTPEAKKILEKVGIVECLDLEQFQFEKIIGNYDIILVGLGLNIHKEQIDKADKLKYIATATTGLDHIDHKYAEEKNIKLLSLRGETEFLNTITGTAELAFGLMLDLLRKMPSAFSSVKQYKWERELFRGHNLYGQTLGIVGLGRLGTWMAKYAKAFGMNVLAFDPYIDENRFKELGIDQANFDTLLEKSNIISIHVHLNQETEGMFNKNVFEKMRKNSYLINTSRGKIVNEDEILLALKDKEIAGYATDVLANELNFNDNFSNHPLIEYANNNDNLIIVPHIGGMTYESREMTDVFIAKKIIKYLK